MLVKRVIILVVTISLFMGVAGCARFSESERQRMHSEASGVGCSVGAAVADKERGALVGGVLGFYVGDRQASYIPLSVTLKRSYIGIDPKLIIDYTVNYFKSKKYAIRIKDYSRGYIVGKEESKVVKKFLWLTWKEQNKIICQIQSDLIKKDRLYLSLTIQRNRKEPLSISFSPVTTSDINEKETVDFLNSLDALVTKKGGKLG